MSVGNKTEGYYAFAFMGAVTLAALGVAVYSETLIIDQLMEDTLDVTSPATLIPALSIPVLVGLAAGTAHYAYYGLKEGITGKYTPSWERTLKGW